MAAGTAGVPTITIRGRRRRVAPRMWQVSGRIVMADASANVACGIEKQFRVCTDIQLMMNSGGNFQYKQSTTERNGEFLCWIGSAVSVTAGVLKNSQLGAILSGTFTATGM